MLSMLLDHIAFTVILIPIIVIFFALIIWTSSSYDISDTLVYVVILSPFLIYFLKDSYRGKSIGKRVMGWQVVHRTTKKPASVLQCFVRNLLIPIWPLEVVIMLFSPHRRLGDIIANTEVIVAEKEPPTAIWKEIKQTKWSMNALWIVVIGAIYCYLLAYVMIYIAYV